MTKRTNKNPGTKAVLALLLVGVAGALALAAYVKFTPASHVPEELKRPAEQAGIVHNDPKPAERQQIHVLTPERNGTDLVLRSNRVEVPKGENAMVYSVNEYLKKANIAPEGARAIGVQVKDHVAYMDFTPSFQQGYSSFEEQALLQGICRTLGQFPEIDEVQFQVDGHPIESLGNVELTKPIKVTRPENGGDPAATIKGGEGG
jgi:hypothetical protein